MDNDIDRIRELARVPEHSLPLMAAMSGGQPLLIGPWLFFAAEDWLMCIAYPLRGKYEDADFEKKLEEALAKTGARHCFAIGSKLSQRLAPRVIESDRYYILSVNQNIPSRLRNQAKRAGQILTVRECCQFTAAHRRLWAEFLQSASMTDRVAGLYARTPTALPLAGGELRLLDAIDSQGNIAASLLLDYSPKHFVSYILGAHSRQHYAPHAADLLFYEMINRAKATGKRYIHLGLGVNDGILRFKRKWGAKAYYPYVMAQWEEKGTEEEENINPARALALAFLRSGDASGRQILDSGSTPKPFGMIWRLEKNGRVSWISGTAHFFCHSFEPSFRKLFRNVDNVIFEGPLDAAFLARVDEAGKSLPAKSKPLIEYMSEAEIQLLEQVVFGPRGKLARALGMENHRKLDARWLLRNARYWHAFFTLWTAFLERRGWKESVDMEAWRVANDMGKNVIAMETLEEQLESLDSLPVERVLRFFRNCQDWKKLASNNLHAYLAGDLEKMMGSSAEFPTRTEHVVGRRDQRFRERMRPWIEAGNTAVFVGCAHMVNLRHMLADDGFTVTQCPFGIWPKIHKAWRDASRPDRNVRW